MRKTVKAVAILLLVSLIDQVPYVFYWGCDPASIVSMERALQTSGFSEAEIREVVAEQKQTLPFWKKAMPYARMIIWIILATAAIALLFSKRWGFTLLYIASAGNLFTMLSFVPLLSWLMGWILTPWGWVFLQVCNFVVLSRLIKCHIQKYKNIIIKSSI